MMMITETFDCDDHFLLPASSHAPTQAVDEGVNIAKRMGAQSIIGVGGGGVIDLGK